jgi:hypothetical protein
MGKWKDRKEENRLKRGIERCVRRRRNLDEMRRKKRKLRRPRSRKK